MTTEIKTTPSVSFTDVNDIVFENAAVVLALFNDEVRLENINKTAIDMLGKKKMDILHRLGGEVFNCTNAWSNGKVVCGIGKHCAKCSLRNTINSTFETGETNYKKEGYLDINVDGEVVRVRLLITTSIVTLDNKNYVLLTLDDITELKEKEVQLQEAVETKDKFFSIISHDLRGPIGAILGLSKIVNENINEENIGTYKEYMDVMHKEIGNTYKLLEDLLFWSRAQKGDISIDPQLLILNKSVDEMASLLNGLANKKSLKIVNHVADDKVVFADQNMLSTILRNLISNAIKFSHEGEQITVRARNRKHFLEISVQDSGVGISEEAKAKLFDVSVNSSTPGTANEKGTGLGLILCKEFVEQHGGDMWVESDEGKGTTVLFTLPIE